MKLFKPYGIAIIVGLALTANSKATVYINDDFNTFANGNLVGQNSWTQLGVSATLPLQVSSGVVVIPGGQTVDNQDAYNNVGGSVIAPAVPPFASPSYFVALLTGQGSGFANFRLTAETNDVSTFSLGARITGQGTDPFTFGSGLAYGVTNEIVLEYNMVAGAGSSYMRVFVNPTDLSTPYLTHVIGAGASDPTGIGSFNISQFASATVGNVGATLDHLVVADTFAEVIPEPSTAVLVGMSLIGMLALRRRRHA
jgi:hypothetical protein